MGYFRDLFATILRLFRFTRSEQRGVAVLSVIMIALFVAIYYKPKPEVSPIVVVSAVDTVIVAKPRTIIPNRPVAKYEYPKTARKPEVYIELNSADSTALRSVRGVGEVISRGILRRRTQLGGFYSLEQLREVYGVRDDNFEAISKQFFIDSAVIQKIDINFASSKEMTRHPYIGYDMAGQIIKGRKLKGGWSNLKELEENKIMTEDEAHKVAPYLSFNNN